MDYKYKDYEGKIKVPVAASTTIEAGDFVCFDGSTGGAVPGDDTGGYLFAGIATHGVDNSAGDLGDKEVEIIVSGLFLLVGDGNFAITDNGATAYISDAQEAAPVAQVSNNVVLGIVKKYVSSTSVWVEIGRI
jgi:hypothetical protein